MLLTKEVRLQLLLHEMSTFKQDKKNN